MKKKRGTANNVEPLIQEALRKLSSETHEPLCAYVYDLNALAAHARQMVNVLPKNCELYYAAKANAEAPVLETLKPIVHGFEAASGGELAWLRGQLPTDRIIFGGPGKLDSELRQAIQYNTELIHVESLYELQRLQDIAVQMNATVDILLRMNIAVDGVEATRLAMGGKPSPFGLSEDQLSDALCVVNRSTHLNLKGFHFHLMSHQLCRHNHLKLMAHYFDTFKRWQVNYQLSVSHLNVGGGVGVNYLDASSPFDWKAFCNDLDALIDEKNMAGVQIRFECGRYVTAACGYYCMEVLDIKHSYGECFIVAKGGTHHFRTPAAQNHSHPFSVYPANHLRGNAPNVTNERVTIVGQLCTPKDILAKQEKVETVNVGDYIVFKLAGAYAWNISHQNFLMHEKPAFVYANG